MRTAPLDRIPLWPQYLDDDGGGLRCYLRHDFAFSRGEAEKRIENMGFEWDFRTAECAVVWMVPRNPDAVVRNFDWYDEVPEGTDGAARYWKFSWE